MKNQENLLSDVYLKEKKKLESLIQKDPRCATKLGETIVPKKEACFFQAKAQTREYNNLKAFNEEFEKVKSNLSNGVDLI